MQNIYFPSHTAHETLMVKSQTHSEKRLKNSIKNIRKKKSSFLVTFWQERNWNILWQLGRSMERETEEDNKRRYLTAFEMAWKGVRTWIYAHYWRTHDVENHGCPCQSARDLMMMKQFCVTGSFLYCTQLYTEGQQEKRPNTLDNQ